MTGQFIGYSGDEHNLEELLKSTVNPRPQPVQLEVLLDPCLRLKLQNNFDSFLIIVSYQV